MEWLGGAEATVTGSIRGLGGLRGGRCKATGLICFDEVHKAKNLVPSEEKASTKTGLYVERLQNFCPKA